MPGDLADGDADTLAGMTCMADSVAVYDGMDWVCAPVSDTDTLATLPCSNGEIARFQGGAWIYSTDDTGSGDITGVTAGSGLSGGGGSGDVTLSVDTSQIQSRVTGTCAAGSSIREIDASGNVTCESDDVGSGDITAVTVGTGISGGGTSGAVTVSLDTSYADGRYVNESDVSYTTISSNGSSVNGLIVGRHYLFTISGYARNRGNDNRTPGDVVLSTGSNGTGTIAVTLNHSGTVNWHDGQAPINATFIAEATATRMYGAVDWKSSSDRGTVTHMRATLLP